MSDYVPPMRWRLTKSYAASSIRNKRNLESNWYPLWNIFYSDLIRDREDLILAPQCRFHFSLDDYDSGIEDDDDDEDDGSYDDLEFSGREEEEEAVDGGEAEEAATEDVQDVQEVQTSRMQAAPDSSSDPIDIMDVDEDPIAIPVNCVLGRAPARQGDEHVPLFEPINAVGAPQRDNDCHIGSDVSNMTEKTAPDSHCSEAFPDFAILHLCARTGVEFEDADLFNRLFTSEITITHECCALLGENKPGPGRRLRGAEFADALSHRFDLAKAQMLRHCQHLFRKHKRSSEVYAVLASGPYWRYRLVHWRDTLPGTDGKYRKVKEWSDVFEIGERSSRVAMQKLRARLNNLKKIVPLGGETDGQS